MDLLLNAERCIYRALGQRENCVLRGPSRVVRCVFHPLEAVYFWLGARRNVYLHYDFQLNTVEVYGLKVAVPLFKHLNELPIGTEIIMTKGNDGTWFMIIG